MPDKTTPLTGEEMSELANEAAFPFIPTDPSDFTTGTRFVHNKELCDCKGFGEFEVMSDRDPGILRVKIKCRLCGKEAYL